MNRSTAVAFAIVATLTVAVLGFLVGARYGAPPAADVDRAEVAALVRQAIAEQIKASPVGGAPSPAVDLSPDQQTEVEAIIKNYLIANPEIVRDAINELQRREDLAAQQAQVAAITENKELLFNSNRQIVLGNPDGDVTLVEFFDYNCTYCRRGLADMTDLIAKDPNLRVVLKEFPVLGDGSVQAAQVAVAVRLVAPEKYDEFHHALLGEKGQVDGERALAVAGEVGLNPEELRAKLSDSEIQATINESYDLAGKLNLTGTPSYVTRKEVIVGAVGYPTLRSRLDQARDCAKSATC
jgi:protein-disulfide isomerase